MDENNFGMGSENTNPAESGTSSTNEWEPVGSTQPLNNEWQPAGNTPYEAPMDNYNNPVNTPYNTTTASAANTAPKSGSKALEVCALIFGILGIVCCVCYGLFGLIGLILSIICLATGKKSGLSIAGLICSILGVILTIVMFAIGLNAESITKKIAGTNPEITEDYTDEYSIDTEDVTTDDTEVDTEDDTEDDTEAPSTEAPVNNASSDDWKSGEMTIDGKVITFPCAYSELEALGFILDDDYASEELEGNHYTTTCYAENDAGQEIGIRFSNATSETLPVTECDVYGISFDDFYELPSVVLCNGITMGMAKDDVVAIMGTPDYEYEGEGDSSYSTQEWYIDPDHSYYGSLDITYSDDKVSEISFEYLYY